jgi:acetyl esterase/lipase
MTFFDPNRVTRPEVNAVLERIEKVRAESRDLFLANPANQDIDLDPLWTKVMDGNERWFRGEKVAGLLTFDEKLYLARLHRFVVEYRADHLEDLNPIPEDVEIQRIDAGGVPAELQIAPASHTNRTILYFHGGGYIMGSPHFMRSLTVKMGAVTGMRVLSLDYRLAPEHSYPAAVNDCVAAYRWLLEMGIDSLDIIVAGDSAGGYLTLQTLLRARDQGLASPAGAVCISPGTDLALTGATYRSHAPTDPVLADIGLFWWVETHLSGADPYDPEVSPLFADLHDLPQILIQASASEMMLDDTTAFADRARDAGVDVTVQTWEDTMHVFHSFDLPEAAEALESIGEFADRISK